MAFYFSSETMAFYDTDVFPVSSLPANKVEIAEGDYTELMTKQNQGYVIKADNSGNPYAVAQGEAAATDMKHSGSIATTLALGHVKIGDTMQTDNDGTINLKDGAVSTTKIADEAVTTAKIADEAVTTDKLADGAVTEEKLEEVKELSPDESTLTMSESASGFVLSVKDGGVTTNKLADSAVTTAKISNDAVTRDKIANDAVGIDEIVDGAVTTAKISNDAVTTDKLADDSVSGAKLQSKSVVYSKIDDNAVRTVHILDGNVTTDKLADGAVTTAKIALNGVHGKNIFYNILNETKEAVVNDTDLFVVVKTFGPYLYAGSVFDLLITFKNASSPMYTSPLLTFKDDSDTVIASCDLSGSGEVTRRLVGTYNASDANAHTVRIELSYQSLGASSVTNEVSWNGYFIT